MGNNSSNYDIDTSDDVLFNPKIKELKQNKDIDRFGFYLNDKFHNNSIKLTETESQKRKVTEALRIKKWNDMILNWDLASKSSKLKSRVRKGIPDSLRGKVWRLVLEKDMNKWRDKYSLTFLSEKVKYLDSSVLDDIEKDVNRTFPKHIVFEKQRLYGLNSLRKVLQWYAAIDQEVGYCQGMAFVAALFLIYLNEEDSFYAFTSILFREKFPLRNFYLPNMVECQRILHVYAKLLKLYAPKASNTFETEGIVPSM